MKYLYLFVLISGLALSCSPEKKYATELQELDVLKQQLDSINTLSATIDYDSLIYMRQTCLEIERQIKAFYKADTINQDFANKMTYIKRVRKSLRDIEFNRNAIEKESKALTKQFNDLDADIRNGALNQEQITQYLGEEKQAFDNFQLSFKGIYVNQKTQKSNFYFAEPTISAYIELIKPQTD